MTDTEMKSRLMGVMAVSAEYCKTVENATETTRRKFVETMLSLLPRIYLEFTDLAPQSNAIEEDTYFQSYVDEDYYESLRRHMENLLGPDDTFLETFEEDMKYSDSPIAASISESLADIFQPLYNFLSIARDSEGDDTVEAYLECRSNFTAYWAQTLCNVLRALNHLYYNSEFEDEPEDEDLEEDDEF